MYSSKILGNSVQLPHVGMKFRIKCSLLQVKSSLIMIWKLLHLCNIDELESNTKLYWLVREMF